MSKFIEIHYGPSMASSRTVTLNVDYIVMVAPRAPSGCTVTLAAAESTQFSVVESYEEIQKLLAE